MSKQKVAIVTVNYDGKEDTLELLKSLKKLDIKDDDLEVKTIVVDNGSSDGLVDLLVKDYPEIDVLQNGQNLGFAGGYNRGINYAFIWGADYVLIINNDCLIKDADLIYQLIKTAKSDRKIGLVSPKIYFAPGFEFHKDRYSESDKGKVIWYGGGSFDWNNIQAIHRALDEVDSEKYNEVEEVEFVSGACMLIKREVALKIGLFDEDFFAYLEDMDFLRRVFDAGYKAFYNGEVAIYHKVSQTAGIGSPTTDYFHTRNRLILGFKYASLRTKFALWRQAIWLLLFGRVAQRQGVWDFLNGKRGGAKPDHLEGGQVKYPLKLSIVIVSFNTADLTQKLLQSIFNKESGFNDKSMEVIVLDNGSKDHCQEVIKDYLPKIQYLQNTENTGFSRGYNKGIRFSQGQYILMLNSDIEIMEGGLTEMVKWADYYEGEAVLGGKLVFPDESSQDSVFHLPTFSGAFKEYFLAQKGSYFMYLPKGEKPNRVDGMVMACYLIPWKIISQVGLLDEGTFIFFEDIEYARRLKQAGYPLYFVPSAHFIHHHGGATKRIGQEKADELLKQAAAHYHGRLYYQLLSFILYLGQKLGRVKTPKSRWTEE